MIEIARSTALLIIASNTNYLACGVAAASFAAFISTPSHRITIPQSIPASCKPPNAGGVMPKTTCRYVVPCIPTGNSMSSFVHNRGETETGVRMERYEPKPRERLLTSGIQPSVWTRCVSRLSVMDPAAFLRLAFARGSRLVLPIGCQGYYFAGGRALLRMLVRHLPGICVMQATTRGWVHADQWVRNGGVKCFDGSEWWIER